MAKWIIVALMGLTFFGCIKREKSAVKEAPSPDSEDLGIFGYGKYPKTIIFDKKSQRGSLDAKPWSDTYWPLGRAGLAERWVNPRDFRSMHHEFPHVDDPDYQTKSSQIIEGVVAEASKAASANWMPTFALSAAAKYDIARGDPGFSMLRGELQDFADNKYTYETRDIEWGWMGHCHGWAPAAYHFDAPVNAVMVKNSSNQEVLLTQGDIRGFLTKGAADNGMEGTESFVGTRCDFADKTLKKDRYNRILDGYLEFRHNKDIILPIRIALNGWINHSEFDDVLKLKNRGARVLFRFGPNWRTSELYWLEGIQYLDRNTGTVEVEIFSTKKPSDGGIETVEKGILLASQTRPWAIGCSADELGDKERCSSRDMIAVAEFDAKVLSAENIGPGIEKKDSEIQNFTTFRYQKMCRDLNPATFHKVLIDTISMAKDKNGPPKSKSFVFDVTRDDQVWNHPVYSFQSVIGQPTRITSSDPYRAFRHPDAEWVVDVNTLMLIGIEIEPKAVYTPDDDHLATKVYHYTLELDSQLNVIGGEWHGRNTFLETWAASHPDPTKINLSVFAKPAEGEELWKKLREDIKLMRESRLLDDQYYLKTEAPDFAWRFPKDAKLSTGKVDVDFVHGIHACSIDKTLKVKTVASTANGETINYVECSLNPPK